MRGLVLVGCLTLLDAHVGAELRGPNRWQDGAGAPAVSRVWGTGSELYGVGGAGAYRSRDGGATWRPVDGAGAANGVWGSGPEDVWIVRARTIHHSTDGVAWTTQSLPVLSYGAVLEGMWGIDRERWLFGVDRSDGAARGVILRSRDGGATWRKEDVPELERIAGMWGSAANDVYAVGARGVVLHSRGDGGWTIVRAPSGGSLEGVWGANAKSIYAVGSDGAIVHSTDGRTWTPRYSGVRYTLSSVIGRGNEIYVGSAEGPPLRSRDGVTWTPVTALVQRGQVWATDKAVVAAANGVQFLGETRLLAASSVLPRRDAMPPSSELDTVELEIRKYEREYKHAATLLRIARETLTKGPPKQLIEKTMNVGSVTGCGPALDQPAKNPTPGTPTDLVVSLSCAKPCAVEPRPEVTGLVELWRDRKKVKVAAFLVTPPARWCSAKSLDLAPFTDDMGQQYAKMLDELLDADLKTARLVEDEIDTYAQYVLGGGGRATAYLELAQLLKRPFTWRGFFWNHLPHNLTVCGTVDVAKVEDEGDRLAAQGSHASALKQYQLAVACEPRVVLKAYHVACKAHDWPAAKLYYRQYAGRTDQLAQLCVREGMDPRTP